MVAPNCAAVSPTYSGGTCAASILSGGLRWRRPASLINCPLPSAATCAGTLTWPCAPNSRSPEEPGSSASRISVG